MVNKDIKIYLSLVAIIILIIAVILWIKNIRNPENNIDEEVIKCIASKAVMYSQNGCSHCISQKNILGSYVSLFNIIECNENDNLKKCTEAGIIGTPSWIINNQKYEGVQSIAELKNLTGC